MPTDLEARFTDLAEAFHAERFRWHPTWAGAMGVHAFDAHLEDFSLAGAQKRRDRLLHWQGVFSDPALGALSPTLAADRTWLLAILDGALYTLEKRRPLETDPDHYVSGLTEAAFALINRDYAPAEDRLRCLLARMARMPAVLELARENLGRPPRIFTQIALDQLEGNRDYFRESVPAAFEDVTNAGLLVALAGACAEVDTALVRFGDFMRDELLPRSDGDFAIGEAGLLRKLHADELLDLPLDRLLEVGEADFARNQRAMREAAAAVDPAASVAEVLARFGQTHVAPDELLSTAQGMLERIVDFTREHDLLTIPEGPMPDVVETPPFLRATTSAAMDTPGPFETDGSTGFYYMTLPNPAWPAEEQAAYMSQWTRPLIANLSVHEAYPGHYVQFLLTPAFPTLTRKVLYAQTNVEGWAHYCEEMMLEEGFGGDDPWARIAQLQDALLRNARVVVGIRLHTGRMTVEEAQAYFEREAYLAAPVARSEAWRGATDPTYGYYTLGKLMLRKLREDVRERQGAAFTLKAFHDAFLALGPLPLPLVREAMLGAIGQVL